MTEQAKAGCPMSGNFNFCFWAKFIVGIPALFIGGYVAAVQFTDPLMQSAAWIGMVMFMVWAAVKIDNLPALQKKVHGSGTGSCGSKAGGCGSKSTGS